MSDRTSVDDDDDLTADPVYIPHIVVPGRGGGAVSGDTTQEDATAATASSQVNLVDGESNDATRDPDATPTPRSDGRYAGMFELAFPPGWR